MNFSQRIGLEPATKPFQTNSMDQSLRNSLWNEFDRLILDDLRSQWTLGGHFALSKSPPNAALFVRLWVYFFKSPLSTLPRYAEYAAETVHNWYFNSNTPWNKAYDFVEAIGDLQGNLQENAEMFRVLCNSALQRESSAYRFVGNTISPITNEAEIKAIEEAATTDENALRLVSTHIETALRRLSDRNNPDYRNSMKESISAVEALCKIIAQTPSATLGPALDAVKAKVNLHPSLQAGFKALYNYTSDTHGIRHALKDDGTPEQEDATFMLVSCSAFVNYLTEKARKNGLLPK